jgi:hypothetical protein
VHLTCSSGRLRFIQTVIALSFAFYLVMGTWPVLVESQSSDNSTLSSTAQETTRVNEILNDICESPNNSVSESAVEIRCILRETRNAISNDSANIALELIEAADKKLAADFGNSTNSSD